MEKYNDMEGVTLQQIHEWLKINRKYTWCIGEGGGFNIGGKPMVKYFDYILDTRDMQVFNIKCEIAGEHVMITTANQCFDKLVQEKKFKNVLEWLDYEIAKRVW